MTCVALQKSFFFFHALIEKEEMVLKKGKNTDLDKRNADKIVR